MATSYSEKLKDPRWQRKRLEVLERANWECEGCGESTKTLHVHHRWYVRGREPWEYEENELVSLCERCHERANELQVELQEALSKSCSILRMLGYAKGLDFRWGDTHEVHLSGMPDEEFHGLCDAWAMPPGAVEDFVLYGNGGRLRRGFMRAMAVRMGLKRDGKMGDLW